MEPVFLYYVDKSGGGAVKNAYCFFVYAAFCLKRLFYIFRAFLLAVEYYQHVTVLPFIIGFLRKPKQRQSFDMPLTQLSESFYTENSFSPR